MAPLPWQQVAAAGDMTGVYTGRFNGEPARASLSADSGAITGTLDVSGYVYRVVASQSGDNAHGLLIDQTGAMTPLALEINGSQLGFRVFADDRQTVLLEFVLTRHERGDAAGADVAAGAGETSPGEAGSAAQPALQAPTMGIDPVLVGRWANSESYSDFSTIGGNFSAVTETVVTLYGDGTYQYGPSRVIGGGDAGSFDSGVGVGGPGGRWGAADRILYTLEEGGWAPYARYYVEGNTLMLTFGNGSRVLWHRR